MQRICFLDVENTIIESWDQPYLIKIWKLKEILEYHNIKNVVIFSYAINNSYDAEYFNINMKEMIETALNIKILDVLTVEEIILNCFGNFNDISMYQFKNGFGKFHGLLKYLENDKNMDIILIDDLVEDCIVEFKDRNVFVKCIKV